MEFKWIELGLHHCVSNECGKVIGYIVVDPPNARKCPVSAYLGNKQLGLYIDAQSAKAAVEQAIENQRTGAA